jgi:hypothetical protein
MQIFQYNKVLYFLNFNFNVALIHQKEKED